MLKTETLVVTFVADDFNEHIFEFKGSELAVFEYPIEPDNPTEVSSPERSMTDASRNAVELAFQQDRLPA